MSQNIRPISDSICFPCQRTIHVKNKATTLLRRIVGGIICILGKIHALEYRSEICLLKRRVLGETCSKFTMKTLETRINLVIANNVRYFSEVNNKDTRTMFVICSKVTIKKTNNEWNLFKINNKGTKTMWGAY